MNNISDPLATMMIKITNNDEQSSSLDYCIDEIQHNDSDQKQSCFINSFSNMMATKNNNVVDGDDDDNDQKQQTLSECDDLFSQYRLECEKWLLDDSLIASLDQEKYISLLRNMVKDLLDQNECLVSNIMEIKQESANRINELRRNLENTAARTEEVMLSLQSHELCLKNFVQQHCCECCACDMRLLEFKLCHGPYCDQLFNHPENISSNPLKSPCWSFGHLLTSVVHQTSHFLTNKESSSSNCLHNVNSEMRFMNLVKLIDKKIQQLEIENQQLRKENDIIRELNSLINCRNGTPLMLNEWRHNNFNNRKLSYTQRTEKSERNHNHYHNPSNSCQSCSTSYNMDSPSISSTSSSSLCLSPNIDRDSLSNGGGDFGNQTTSMLMMMMPDDGDDIQELIHDKYNSTLTTTSMIKNNASMLMKDEIKSNNNNDDNDKRDDCSFIEEQMLNSLFNLDSKTTTVEMKSNSKNDHHSTDRQINNGGIVYYEENCDSCRLDNDSGCSTDLIPSQTDMQSLLALSDLDYDMDNTHNNNEHELIARTDDDEQQKMMMMMMMTLSSSSSMNSSLLTMSTGSSPQSFTSKDNDITRNFSNHKHNYVHQDVLSRKQNHNHDQNYDDIKEPDKSFCERMKTNGSDVEIEQLRIRVNLADRLIPKLYGKLLYYMNQRNLVLSQFRQENRLREKCKQDLSELTECIIDNVDCFEKRSSTILASINNNDTDVAIKNKNLSEQKISCR